MTPCYLPSQVKMPESAEPPNLEMSKELQDIISEDTLWLQEQGSTSWAVFNSHRNQPTKTHADISSMLPICNNNKTHHEHHRPGYPVYQSRTDTSDSV